MIPFSCALVFAKERVRSIPINVNNGMGKWVGQRFWSVAIMKLNKNHEPIK